MPDHLLTACPAWCDRAHEDYTPRASQPSGDVTHWRTIHADHDPTIEYVRVTQRTTWKHHGSYSSTRPGQLRLRLTPHWADADLNGPAGDELATTIARGRQLIARLEDGGDR